MSPIELSWTAKNEKKEGEQGAFRELVLLSRHTENTDDFEFVLIGVSS